MERSEILTAMAELKLYGMKAAFDEIISTAVKRQHEPQRIVGDLLAAEITEKQARSIRYVTSGANLYQSHRFEVPIIRRAPRARSYQGCRRVQGQSRPGPSGGREGRGQP